MLPGTPGIPRGIATLGIHFCRTGFLLIKPHEHPAPASTLLQPSAPTGGDLTQAGSLLLPLLALVQPPRTRKRKHELQQIIVLLAGKF